MGLRTIGMAARRVAPKAVFLTLLVACTTPVSGSLDDREANEIVGALASEGIQGTKEADPTAEGKFRISVSKQEAAVAMKILRDESLPRERPKGVVDNLGQGSLLSSAISEHVKVVAGTAGDLERSILSVEGVVHARVHLNVPAQDPLRIAGAATPKATASVLYEYRGNVAPLSVDSIQKLVSGAVAGLSTADVAVVSLAKPARTPATDLLTRVGPFSVGRGSERPLQVTLALLSLALLLGSGIFVALYAKYTRLRNAQLPAAFPGTMP